MDEQDLKRERGKGKWRIISSKSKKAKHLKCKKLKIKKEFGIIKEFMLKNKKKAFKNI